MLLILSKYQQMHNFSSPFKLQYQNTKMQRPEKPMNYISSKNEFINSLKMKYTSIKPNSLLHNPQDDLLNAYTSLRCTNNNHTDRQKIKNRSPRIERQITLENKKQNNKPTKMIRPMNSSYKYGGNTKKNEIPLRQCPINTITKPYDYSIKIKNSNFERQPLQLRKSTLFQNSQFKRRQVQNKQEQSIVFEEGDSPIKLIYQQNQVKQKDTIPAKEKNEPSQNKLKRQNFYKLQRQKTSKTILSIDNILNSIRTTLNK